jgi:hypothetical protein
MHPALRSQSARAAHHHSTTGSMNTASAIDGTTAQGFLLISPAGRKKRLSSILTKYGIADETQQPMLIPPLNPAIPPHHYFANP